MIANAPVWPDQAPPYIASVSSAGITAGGVLSRYLKLGSASALGSPEEQKIDALEALGHNWDLRGSPPPSSAAVASAREWLDPLREAAALSGSAWRVPHISASDDGEITFEWWRDERKITLYFSAHAPEFLTVWGPHIFEQMDSGEILSSESFRALWLWLNAA